MVNIIGYIKDYFGWINKIVLALVTALAALLIYLNYHFGLEKWMTTELSYPLPDYTGHYILFFIAFALPYFFVAVFNKQNHFLQPKFVFLVLLAPAIFAVKMAMSIHFNVSADIYTNEYWNHVLHWPFRLLVIVTILFLTWKFIQPTQSFYGLTAKQFN